MDSYQLYQLGIDSLNKQEYTEAIQFLKESLLKSKHFKTYEKLFEIYKILGMNDESNIHLIEAFMLNPNNDKVALNYSMFLIQEARKEEAKEILQKVLSRNPTFKPASHLLKRISEWLEVFRS